MTEWISIEERLPHASGEYLIFRDGMDWVISCFFNKNKEKPGGHWNDNMVTHWAPLPEMPKKKRWRPKESETYFRLDAFGKIQVDSYDNTVSFFETLEPLRDFLGVYKTKEEAELIRDKIKKLVESEIGEA